MRIEPVALTATLLLVPAVDGAAEVRLQSPQVEYRTTREDPSIRGPDCRRTRCSVIGLKPQNNALGAPFLAAAYHGYDLRIVAEVADLLGNRDDAERYLQLYERRRRFFNATFLDAEQPRSPRVTDRVTVPANTTATLSLPTTDEAGVKEGGRSAFESAGVTRITYEGGRVVYRLASGSYVFSATR